MGFTVSELMGFLSKAGKNGLLKYNTARTRRTAIKQVFSVEPNWQDIVIDEESVERILRKFTEQRRDEFTVGSFNTYRSRIRSSIDDYRGWLDIGDRYFGKKQVTKIESKIQSSSLKIPVPIREDVIVTIDGLPGDLNREESDMIIKVIKAYTHNEDN